MFQIQSQGLRPLTTAHLAQTMTLLHMNAAELAQKIERELSEKSGIGITGGAPLPNVPAAIN